MPRRCSQGVRSSSDAPCRTIPGSSNAGPHQTAVEAWPIQRMPQRSRTRAKRRTRATSTAPEMDAPNDFKVRLLQSPARPSGALDTEAFGLQVKHAWTAPTATFPAVRVLTRTANYVTPIREPKCTLAGALFFRILRRARAAGKTSSSPSSLFSTSASSFCITR